MATLGGTIDMNRDMEGLPIGDQLVRFDREATVIAYSQLPHGDAAGELDEPGYAAWLRSNARRRRK
ncbi:MAG: hypothetical protein ACRD3P_15010 [Terriglobales bacterium]